MSELFATILWWLQLAVLVVTFLAPFFPPEAE